MCTRTSRARVLALVVCALAGPAGAAAQQPYAHFIDYSSQCNSGGLWTCASVQVLTWPTPTGGTIVEVRVRNLTASTTPIRDIQIAERYAGDWGDPHGGYLGTYPWTGWTFGPVGPVQELGPEAINGYDTNVGDYWGFPDGSVGNVAGAFFYPNGGLVGCAVTTPPPPDPLDPGGSPGGYYQTCPEEGWTGAMVFRLEFPSQLLPENFHVASVGGHDYGMPPASQTPEPMTLVLFGSGLAGVAAARRRRAAAP